MNACVEYKLFDGRLRRVLMIRYADDGIPFEAITATETPRWNSPAETYESMDWWNFEVVNGGALYRHSSGSGSLDATLFDGSHARIWVAPGVPLRRWVDGVYQPITRRAARALGHRLLRKPLDLKRHRRLWMEQAYPIEDTRNPFLVSAESDGGFAYCNICTPGVFLNQEDCVCRHLRYVDGLDFTGVGSTEDDPETFREHVIHWCSEFGITEFVLEALRSGRYVFEVDRDRLCLEYIQEREYRRFTRPGARSDLDHGVDLPEDWEDDDSELSVTYAVAWLTTLEAGVTLEAEKLTREWLEGTGS